MQAAIDTMQRRQGRRQTVEVPAGTYVVAPILLKSNVTFHLAKDATLRRFTRPRQTIRVIQEFRQPGRQAVVSAVNTARTSPSPAKAPSTVTAHSGGGPSARRSPLRGGWLRHCGWPAGATGQLVVFDHCKGMLSLTGVTVKTPVSGRLCPTLRRCGDPQRAHHGIRCLRRTRMRSIPSAPATW